MLMNIDERRWMRPKTTRVCRIAETLAYGPDVPNTIFCDTRLGMVRQ
jgi:hypothetical protein